MYNFTHFVTVKHKANIAEYFDKIKRCSFPIFLWLYSLIAVMHWLAENLKKSKKSVVVVVVVIVCLLQAQPYKHYKNQYMIYNNK